MTTFNILSCVISTATFQMILNQFATNTNSVMFYIISLILLLLCNFITSEIIACQDIFNSLSSDKNSAKVIDLVQGASVQLYCHFCTENGNNDPKFWYYKKRGREYVVDELNVGHSYDSSKKFVTADHTLIIDTFNTSSDSGIYSCKSGDIADETIFIYVLDGVYKDDVSPFSGPINHWHKYKKEILNPLNEQFENPKLESFISFKNSFPFSFRLKTYWESWGPCQFSNRSKSIRTKIGKCYLQIVPNNIVTISSTAAVNKDMNRYFIAENYDISCRSIKLNELLPAISKIVRYIPNYEATEPCIVEHNIIKTFVIENEHKLTATKQIAENGHYILACPEGSQESKVEWYKDGLILNSSFKHNLGKSEEEPHLTIDSYNSLYIFHATKEEEGMYSCEVDGKKMQTYTIKVSTRCKFLNDDFFRYSIYLGFVLLLTTACYCAGVCVAWHEKSSFADPLHLNINKKQYQHLFSEP